MARQRITPAQALRRFGEPGDARREGQYMVRWMVPADIQLAFKHVRFSQMGTTGFPKVIYMNRLLQSPLERALRNLIDRGLAKEMQSWDGCYIVRTSRGSDRWSLHAWGLAIDVNAATNRMHQRPTLSAAFVKCFTDEGFNWGGHWRNPVDGMHFELSTLL